MLLIQLKKSINFKLSSIDWGRGKTSPKQNSVSHNIKSSTWVTQLNIKVEQKDHKIKQVI